MLATAGGVVFSGDGSGNFVAYDASNGKPLWQYQTGGDIRNSPMSYSVDGKQYIAIASNSALFTFALP